MSFIRWRKAALIAPLLVLGLQLSSDAQGEAVAGCHMMQEAKGLRAMEKQVLEGKISEVKVEDSCKASGKLLVFELSTDKGERTILLGPTWFLGPKNFRFAIHDNVKITGVPLEKNGQEFLAWQIEKEDGKIFLLRDEDGRPVWRGQSPMAKRQGGGMMQ